MYIRRTVLLALAATVPLTAIADIKFYAGLGAGGSRLGRDVGITAQAFESNGTDLVPVIDRTPSTENNPNPRFGQPVTSTLDEFDGTDVGARLFAGVRFGRYFGIEGGYISLGEPDDQTNLSIPDQTDFCNNCRPVTDVAIVVEEEIEGWELYALGAIPFAERWEAFAKIGAIAWDSTFKVTNAYDDTVQAPPPSNFPAFPVVTPPSSTTDDDGTDLAGGLGVNYQATERMILRGEGTWYDIEDTNHAWLLGFNVIVTF